MASAKFEQAQLETAVKAFLVSLGVDKRKLPDTLEPATWHPEPARHIRDTKATRFRRTKAEMAELLAFDDYQNRRRANPDLPAIDFGKFF